MCETLEPAQVWYMAMYLIDTIYITLYTMTCAKDYTVLHLCFGVYMDQIYLFTLILLTDIFFCYLYVTGYVFCHSLEFI